MKTLYKARLITDEDGLEVWIDKYHSVRETPCYYFCVDDHNKWRINSTVLPLKNKLLKRIHKTNSRFAFDTEELSIEHLRMMKMRQLNHMARETAFIKAFLDCGELKSTVSKSRIIKSVPGTRDLIWKYLRFD